MRKWSYSLILSDIMCFVTAYTYREMVCGIEHCGFTAPPIVAFFYAIPFLIGIVICIIIAIKLYKKK